VIFSIKSRLGENQFFQISFDRLILFIFLLLLFLNQFLLLFFNLNKLASKHGESISRYGHWFQVKGKPIASQRYQTLTTSLSVFICKNKESTFLNNFDS